MLINRLINRKVFFFKKNKIIITTLVYCSVHRLVALNQQVFSLEFDVRLGSSQDLSILSKIDFSLYIFKIKNIYF